MILHRHIARHFLVSMLASISLCTGLYVVIDLLVNFHDFLELEPSRLPAHIAHYYLNMLPFTLYFVMPASAICTAVIVVNLMQRNRKWDILRFSGYDVRKAFLFVSMLSLIFVPLTALLQEGLLPVLEDNFLASEADTKRGDMPRNCLTLFDDPASTAVMEQYDSRNRAFTACTVLRIDGHRKITRQVHIPCGKWAGREGSLVHGHWFLPSGARVHSRGKETVRKPGIHDDLIAFTPADIEFEKSRSSFVSTSRLLDLVRTDRGGPELHAEVWMRFIYPMQPLFLAALGFGIFLVFRFPSFWPICLCLLFGYGSFFVLTNSIFTLSAKGVIPGFSGPLLPLVLLLLLNLAVYRRLFR